MKETADTSPLIQRLVTGRLNAPGVLDRSRLQRTYERFSSPPGTQMSSRVFRRIESSAPDTASVGEFVVRKTATTPGPDGSGETGSNTDESNSAFAVGHIVSSASDGLRLMRKAEPASSRTGTTVPLVGTTSALTLNARFSGIDSHGEIARSPSDAPSAPRAATASGTTITGGTISGAITMGAAGIARATSTSGGVANSTMEAVGAGAELTLSSREDHLVRPPSHSVVLASDGNLLMRKERPGTAPPGISGALNLNERSTATDSRAPSVDALPLPVAQRPVATLQRQYAGEPIPRATKVPGESLGGTTSPSAPTSTSGVPHVSVHNGSNTLAPLLLRKPEVVAAPVAISKQAPGTIAAAPGVIARKEAAPEYLASRPPNATAHSPAAKYARETDIDRITSQVEDRLARRLEIERERLGVRPWRRAN